MRKLKICILSDPVDEQYAGVAKATGGFISELKKRNDHQYIFLHQKENPLFEGTEHVITERKNGGSVRRKLMTLPGVLRKLKPDIVHEFAHIGPLILPGTYKKVVTIHDMTPILYPGMHTFFNWFSHKLFLRRALKTADLIITPSEHSRRDIVHFMKNTEEKTRVVPWGVHQQKITETPSKYEIQKPYFLSVGTIEPRKNVDMIIKAFHSVAEYSENIKLVIAGKWGWDFAHVKKEYETSPHKGRIHFLNYVPDSALPGLYSNAEALIYPSKYEGFGFPPLEAMSCGCPVIVSDKASLPEVVGEAGIIVEPKVENVSEAMKKIISDTKTRNRLSQKGIKRARDFTWEKCVHEIVKLYEGLMA